MLPEFAQKMMKGAVFDILITKSYIFFHLIILKLTKLKALESIIFSKQLENFKHTEKNQIDKKISQNQTIFF